MARRRCWLRRRSSGEMDATLNYWNFCAALEAKGFRRVAGIEDLLPKLGAKGRTAMIGYVFDEKWANANQDKIARFIAMTRKAKEILSTSDSEWETIVATDRRSRRRHPRAYRDRYREPFAPPGRRRRSRRPHDLSRAGRNRRPRICRSGAGTRCPVHLSRDPGRLRCLSGVIHRVACNLVDRRCLPATSLPAPPTVFAAIDRGSPFWRPVLDLGVTLLRVALAFTLAMSLGAAIGYLMARSPGRPARRPLADPAAQPAGAVVIVLPISGPDSPKSRRLRQSPVNKLPTAVVTLREGARALDAALDEMATVFAIPRWKKIRHVILPQPSPYIAAAAPSGASPRPRKIVLVAG